MPEAGEEDEVEQVPIPFMMVCEGLLAKPWSLRSEVTLREFLFERGN